MKLLEENIGKIFSDIYHTNVFLGQSPKTIEIKMKINKKDSEKVGLKLSIQKTKIMASDPITSWQIDGETVKIVQTLLSPQDTSTAGHCFYFGLAFSFLLRNLYAGQEATVKTSMEQQTNSKLRKEYVKALYCHLAYLTYMQSTS